MAKYKVKHTSIMHNKKVYGEGSEIELTDVQAQRLSDFVELIPTQSESKTKTQTTKTSNKTKSEAKDTVNEKSENKDGVDGGAKDGE